MLQRERNGASNVQEVEEDGECSADKLIDKIVSLKAKLDQVSKRQGDVKIKGFIQSRVYYSLLQWRMIHLIGIHSSARVARIGSQQRLRIVPEGVDARQARNGAIETRTVHQKPERNASENDGRWNQRTARSGPESELIFLFFFY